MKAKLAKGCTVLVQCARLGTEVMALGDWGHGDQINLKNVLRLFLLL